MNVGPTGVEGSDTAASGTEEETNEGEEEEGYEEESLLHHAASVGDVEVSIL